jgi:predicted metal-dependent HD superfamily phosphohydrolase
MRLYAEQHRHYHNARHIGECLKEFDSVRELAGQPLAVELAIWFHDAIYDPHASDNEERSAGLAGQFLSSAGLGRQFQEPVARLVLATKQHDGSLHPDAPLLVDVDLSILGQPPERFWQYENQIRAEYEWVPNEVFATRRAEILEQFLARKRIYSTDNFFRKYEAQARMNLRASVENLRGGSSISGISGAK